MEEKGCRLIVDKRVQKRRGSKKWVKCYSSNHQILLVGEGDFSFSLCLAQSFGSASNIVASSLDSRDDVLKKYKKAMSHLDDLRKLGACVLHGVDATKMLLHPDLRMRRFDRVIFNFPHAGFHGREDSFSVIQKHKNLVLGFFRNARHMLMFNGEIHVNHKTTAPFTDWNIEELGMQSFLRLIECSDFKKEDFPGYNNKRGDGVRCDEAFPLGKCSTFKFAFNPKAIMPMNPETYSYHVMNYCSTEQGNFLSNYFPLRSHIPDAYVSIHGGGFSNSGIEMLGRAVSGSVYGISSNFLRPSWPASTHVRNLQTDFTHMNMVPLPSLPLPLPLPLPSGNQPSQFFEPRIVGRSWNGEAYIQPELPQRVLGWE